MSYRQIRGHVERAKLEKYLKKLVSMFPSNNVNTLFELFKQDYKDYPIATMEHALRQLTTRGCLKRIRAGKFYLYEPKRKAAAAKPDTLIVPVKVADEYKGPLPVQTTAQETTQVVNLRVRISVELVGH
jgi:hypothetical protein